jgi:tetratricopeptide (TPR) repeat protein
MDKNFILHKYIKNSLTEEEEKVFHDLRQNDAEFRKEIAFHENTKAAIHDYEKKSLKKELIALESRSKKTTVSIFKNSKWLVAASISVLVVIASYLYFDKGISHDELFYKNFEPYANVIEPVERGEEAKDFATKGFFAYEAENYEEALLYFGKIESQEKPTYIWFYEANCLLKLDQPNKAISLFKKHLSSKDKLSDRSNWYLALSYLRINDAKSALKYFEKVAQSPKAYKFKEAREIMLLLK